MTLRALLRGVGGGLCLALNGPPLRKGLSQKCSSIHEDLPNIGIELTMSKRENKPDKHKDDHRRLQTFALEGARGGEHQNYGAKN